MSGFRENSREYKVVSIVIEKEHTKKLTNMKYQNYRSGEEIKERIGVEKDAFTKKWKL